MLAIVLFALYFICSVFSLQPGDRISTLTQTLHSDMKTQWIDLPLHQMPRFGVADNHIFHASLPKASPNSSDYRINPRNDVKVSFTFMGNMLSIPWIPVYSANDRVSLKKLVVTFIKDEFEIVTLKYETFYGPKIMKIDPTHPALRGFELMYMWESVQEEDFALGVITMFVCTIIGFGLLFCLVLCNGESIDPKPRQISRQYDNVVFSTRGTGRRY